MDLEEEIPIPITSTFVGGHGHGHASSPPLHHSASNGPATAAAEDHHQHHHRLLLHGTTNSKKGQAGVKYRECLKNHAASIGGTATDGCGEFMPSGEEGSLEALKCSACGCHRNFHRKEIEGESPQAAASCDCYGHHPFRAAGRKQHHLAGGGVHHRGGGLILSGSADAFGYGPPGGNSLVPRPPPQLIMPLGALQTSESDEMEGVGGGGFMARPPFAKKRFRTKFTPEQKEKMLHFAEKIGWRLQKQEEDVVQQFCQEIGVKRRVLKVWMHNNKHNLAKTKSSSPLQLE